MRLPVMYLPPAFAPAHPAALTDRIRAHPFGTLITQDADGVHADHLPFLFDAGAGSQGVLRGHVARENDVITRCGPATEVLVIFHGPHGYISPNWYPSKHETHRLVPTWNYEVVHARGTVQWRDDARFLRRLLAQLTREHEATEPQPWRMGDTAAGVIDGMLRHITGLEITLTSLAGKFKLSQNREPRDRLAAADVLAARGQHDLAQAMRLAG